MLKELHELIFMATNKKVKIFRQIVDPDLVLEIVQIFFLISILVILSYAD